MLKRLEIKTPCPTQTLTLTRFNLVAGPATQESFAFREMLNRPAHGALFAQKIPGAQDDVPVGAILDPRRITGAAREELVEAVVQCANVDFDLTKFRAFLLEKQLKEHPQAVRKPEPRAAEIHSDVPRHPAEYFYGDIEAALAPLPQQDATAMQWLAIATARIEGLIQRSKSQLRNQYIQDKFLVRHWGGEEWVQPTDVLKQRKELEKSWTAYQEVKVALRVRANYARKARAALGEWREHYDQVAARAGGKSARAAETLETVLAQAKARRRELEQATMAAFDKSKCDLCCLEVLQGTLTPSAIHELDQEIEALTAELMVRRDLDTLVALETSKPVVPDKYESEEGGLVEWTYRKLKAQQQVVEGLETALKEQRIRSAVGQITYAEILAVKEECAILKAIRRQLEDERNRLTAKVIAPIVQRSAVFTAGILPGELVFQEGVLAFLRHGYVIPLPAFSETEFQVAAMALAAALGARSGPGVVYTEELANLGPETAMQFLRNCKAALDTGVIRQFIGVGLPPAWTIGSQHGAQGSHFQELRKMGVNLILL